MNSIKPNGLGWEFTDPELKKADERGMKFVTGLIGTLFLAGIIWLITGVTFIFILLPLVLVYFAISYLWMSRIHRKEGIE